LDGLPALDPGGRIDRLAGLVQHVGLEYTIVAVNCFTS